MTHPNGQVAVPASPSLAVATLNLADATREWDLALSEWWTFSADEFAEVSRRLWLARQALREAIESA